MIRFRQARRIGLIGLLCLTIASRAQALPDFYDLFFNDDTSSTTNLLTINHPQAHSMDGIGDVDWAMFDATMGRPYRVIVRDVGAALDPVLEVYPNGPSAPGFFVDDFAQGEGESFWRVAWPWSGRCWIRVSTDGLGAGATTYTLVVAEESGPNVGLPSITGTGGSYADPEGGKLDTEDGITAQDLVTSTTLYTLSYIAYPAGAFSTGATTALLISGAGGAGLTMLDSPWLVAWHERFPTNFSIVRLGILPGNSLLKPVELGIQLRTQTLVADLSDGIQTWPQTTFRDVPAGSSMDDVKVFRWDAALGIWALYDADPTVTAVGDDWIVATQISVYDPNVANTAFFAAAIAPLTAEVRSWTDYR